MKESFLKTENADGDTRCPRCTEDRCYCEEPLSLELRAYADNMLAHFRSRVRCGLCRGKGILYIPRSWGLKNVFEETHCPACNGSGRQLPVVEAA